MSSEILRTAFSGFAASAANASTSGGPAWDTGATLHDYKTWTWTQRIVFSTVVLVGYDLLHRVVPMIFSGASHLPVKGKHLDQLSNKDWAFIAFNRLTGVTFVYNCLQFMSLSSTVPWELEKLSVMNTLFALPALFIFYDFFYCLWHRLLHVRGLYGWIHKHHHRQVNPTRGNLDAMNVHPVEFIVGEYLHLLAMMAVPAHALTCAVFIISLGVLTSLNHTRYDINIPYGIFSVRWHDLHHRLPQSNYGQYTMVWDHLWGSYREEKDLKDS
jgi:sterol desaturase/sphingolipid hydroxylase (fatty acid hydroxylase superfamily)